MDTKKMIKETIPERPFPASVARVLDNYTVVINRGSEHGVEKNQRFQIYGLDDEEIIDPENGASLGRLEIVKGIGTVVHIQSQIATLKSLEVRVTEERKIVKNRHPFLTMGAMGGNEEETITPTTRRVPFDDPEVGDKVRPI